MKLKWIRLKFHPPLLSNPTSIGELDEDKERKIWREVD